MVARGGNSILLFSILILSASLVPYGEFSPREVFSLRGLLLLFICTYSMHRSPSQFKELGQRERDSGWMVIFFFAGFVILWGTLWLEYEGAIIFNPNETPLGRTIWFIALISSYSFGVWLVSEPFATFTRYVAQTADPSSIAEVIRGEEYQEIIKQKKGYLVGDPNTEIAKSRIKNGLISQIQKFDGLGQMLSETPYRKRDALIDDVKEKFCEMVLDKNKCDLLTSLDPKFNWSLEWKDVRDFITDNLDNEFEEMLLIRMALFASGRASAQMARNLILIVEFEGEVKSRQIISEHRMTIETIDLFEGQRSKDEGECRERLARQFSLLLFIFRELFLVRIHTEAKNKEGRMTVGDGKMALRAIIGYILREDPGKRKSFFEGDYRFYELDSGGESNYNRMDMYIETSEEVKREVKSFIPHLPRLSRRLDVINFRGEPEFISDGANYEEILEDFDRACIDFIEDFQK